MECLDYQTLISATLDGELSSQDEQILAEHLKICPNCTKFLKNLQELRGIASKWENIPIPIELEKQILAQTVKTYQEPKPVFSFLKGYYQIPRSLAWASIFLFLMLVLNSIFNLLKTITESEKGLTISPTGTKVQKVVLTDKDVVRTYTIFGK